MVVALVVIVEATDAPDDYCVYYLVSKLNSYCLSRIFPLDHAP